METNTEYFRTNEESEPANALFIAKEFLMHPKDDHYELKWTIIALHNALQGFMILILSNTSDLPIINLKEEMKKTLNNLQTRECLPIEDRYNERHRIILENAQTIKPFGELLKKVKKEEQLKSFPWDYKEADIMEINRMRNQFIHYKPMGYSIYIKSLKKKLLSVVETIEFMVKNYAAIRKTYTDEERKEILNNVGQCRSILAAK